MEEYLYEKEGATFSTKNRKCPALAECREIIGLVSQKLVAQHSKQSAKKGVYIQLSLFCGRKAVL